MSEREGLLSAIAADPADDTPRLVLADWLDEHDDPLGEFIRVQMALEPLRIPLANPAEEFERNKRLRGIPPGGEYKDASWPVARQLDREGELLKAHRVAWLGEVASLGEDHPNHFEPEFRRGFVASAQIGLTALRQHGFAVRRCCPALQRLIVLGTLGRGKELASCAALAGLSDLLLAGWLRPDDAAAIANSRHLKHLRSLTVWIGNEGDGPACGNLSKLPGLRDLTLVQMWDERDVADDIAGELRGLRPDCQVRVARPYRRRFPLDGTHIGYYIDAGHLPGGQAVLIYERKRPVVMYFDGEGHLEREEQLDFTDKLVKPPPYSWEDCDGDELNEVLKREIGFAPGPIFVREFHSELCPVGVMCWGVQEEELEDPHTVDPEEGEEIASSIYWWWSTTQFRLPYGNDYWADGSGRIHTS